MAIELHRPTVIHIGSARPGRRSMRSAPATLRAVDVALRGLLVGAGIGILLVAHAGMATLPVLGVIALGAALLSGDP